MYIGFLNDQKKLNRLIQQEKKISVKIKKRKRRKRKYVLVFLLGTKLAFTALNASANAKPIDYNGTSCETVIIKDLNRGGFSALPVNMEILSRQLSPEYVEYQKKFNSPTLSKRFDTLKFSQVRFKELAKDPNARTTVYHKTTVDEARSALQSEIIGIIEGVERIPRPYCKSVDLDFRISGPAPYSHLDMKHPVGSAILKKQGRNITLKTMSFDLGESISEQKNRFCGLEGGPKSSENVLHIVDLCYVPKNEKEIVKGLCLKGAGNPEGILFLNTK